MNATIEELDEFTRAYLLCALWTWDENAPSGQYEFSGRPEELFPRFSDEALERAKADCAKFQSENREMLAAFQPKDAHNGHDFWLTRNGHGAGFWDRPQTAESKFEELGDLLTDAAHKFRECDLYEGDDGKLYLS